MIAHVPNALTISRILATPVVCVLLVLDSPWSSWLALVTYILACATDFFDGYFARALEQQSSFGRFLDPIADKLLVASVLLILVGIDRLSGAHMVPAAIILWREILVSGLREHLAEFQVGLPVTRLAKWKTAVQMVAIGFLVVGGYGPAVFGVSSVDIGIVGVWVAALLTLVTGWDYFRAGLANLGDRPSSTPPPMEGSDAARDAVDP